MGEGRPQCAVATHGESGDSPGLAVANESIMRLDIRNEFAEEKVAIAVASVGGVYEEAGVTFRRDHNKIADLVLLAKVFDESPAAAAQKSLFVLAQAVKKIERRKFLVWV